MVIVVQAKIKKKAKICEDNIRFGCMEGTIQLIHIVRYYLHNIFNETNNVKIYTEWFRFCPLHMYYYRDIKSVLDLDLPQKIQSIFVFN